MDDEVKGKGNSINYKFRMHDPRIGRFFAVDPLSYEYPFYSPYAFSGNRVIDANELEGLEPQVHNSVETDEPFNKGIMAYDLASKHNIIPSGVQSSLDTRSIGSGYNIIALRHPESEEVLTYIAIMPGMTLDYIDPDEGRVYKQNQVRYDWVIAPDHIDEFENNVETYSVASAGLHNYGADFSLSPSTMDVLEGDYLGMLGKEWKAAITNPFYIVQVVGGTLIARGAAGKGSSNKKSTGGAARAAKYSNEWGSASLADAIDKFAPGAKGGKTSTGKMVYKNSNTGIQVVADDAGGYFRIEDTNHAGKRRYLNMDGNIPNNKIVDGKPVGRSQGEYNQETHFNNSDN